MTINLTDTTNIDGLSELNRILNLLNDNVAGDGNNVRVFHGYGTPEGNVAANVGSLYMRLDGGAGTSVYVKQSGTEATGWQAIDVDSIVPLARGGTGVDLSTLNQGDIYYDNGSSGFIRLTPGTSGQYLQTQGTSANPQWSSLTVPAIHVIHYPQLDKTATDSSWFDFTYTELNDLTYQFYKKGQSTVYVVWEGWTNDTTSGRVNNERAEVSGEVGDTHTLTMTATEYSDTIDISGLSDDAWHELRLQVQKTAGLDSNSHVDKIRWAIY